MITGEGVRPSKVWTPSFYFESSFFDRTIRVDQLPGEIEQPAATPVSERGFEILLEDEQMIALSKQAGLATQAPVIYDSLEARLRRYLALPGQPTEEVYLGIPHRLDRPVTGVILFAKTRRAARQLSKQFERRQIKKTYWACVERVVEPLKGTWNDYLYKVHGHPQTMVVEATHASGQEAILHYQTRGFHSAGAWLEIELETGRTHQIRVQASSRGHAILGDSFYGSRILFGEQTEDERLRQIALHARSISFVHPTTHEPLTLEAPLSLAWDGMLGI